MSLGSNWLAVTSTLTLVSSACSVLTDVWLTLKRKSCILQGKRLAYFDTNPRPGECKIFHWLLCGVNKGTGTLSSPNTKSPFQSPLCCFNTHAKWTVFIFSFSLLNSRATNKNALAGIMFLSTVFTLFCLMASVPSRCVSECNDQLFSGRTPLHWARENYRKAPWGDPSSISLPARESLLILIYLYLTFTYFYSYLLIRYLFYSYPFYPFLFMSHWLTPSFSLISIHDQLISNQILHNFTRF